MKMLLAGTRFPVIALGKPLGSVCGIKGNFSSSGIYYAPGQATTTQPNAGSAPCRKRSVLAGSQ